MTIEFWVTSFAAPGRAGRIAKRIEDAGWDGLLFTDSQHHNGDVYQSLALASVATKRIGLGTGVTNPLTRNAAGYRRGYRRGDSVGAGRIRWPRHPGHRPRRLFPRAPRAPTRPGRRA